MKISFIPKLTVLVLVLLSCKKPSADSVAFGDGETIGGDILISEILADPFKDGAEFIELYNQSDKVIDLSRYAIASANSKGLTGTPRAISKSTLYIYPDSYRLLSKNPQAVLSQYPVPPIEDPVLVKDFPQLTNTEGSVLLLRDEEIIDSLHYSEKMHDPLIRSTKGVSLERVSFRTATNRTGNFISGSATTGYATPGYRNAQRENSNAGGPLVRLSKRTLRRANHETVAIQFNLPTGGRMANIAIFTAAGLKVHQLVQNHRLGTLDYIHWDGHTAGDRRLAAGSYYIHVELFDSAGLLQSFKEVCFLSD